MAQARAQATRNTVLTAAARVFERRGFAGATIAHILDEGGVTKGALYFHFDSKEWAVSSGGCTAIVEDEFVQDFGGFTPVEGLAGAVVEFVGDGVEFSLSVTGEVGAFGEVLP